MTHLAALTCGVLAGLGIVALLHVADMLRERSGLAVLLAAVAAFYPVFAVQAAAGTATILLHLAVFAAFAGFAVLGYRTGSAVLAGGLLLHGLFDVVAFATGHPGPRWWPAFCGALDVTTGLAILALLRRGRVA